MPFADPEITNQIGTVCRLAAIWRDLGVFDFRAVSGRAAVKQQEAQFFFQAGFKPTCAQGLHNPVRKPLTLMCEIGCKSPQPAGVRQAGART